ncbi:DUF1883 domain-containing protein [Hafnia alvei]|jgi:hypothetical protein|uniref:DUF1883 domain-containing protein n=1 Tax=Hafnia alvei TaxID=569 RepID=UPI000620EB7F|nr:DUF1883 domain-containing protein [Hafnia alvei]ANC41742.1 hypothetical protein A6V27_15885 [Hafnia alvei]KKI44944.1 hypothetical protein XK86_07585 [Hafnia alvei]TBL88197.1 DUF1883 domain-containing protein [Hafnia alvei]
MKQTQLYLTTDSYVKVMCPAPAKVLLINAKYYNKFRLENWTNYHGGSFMDFPALIGVPYEGIWNVIIETHNPEEMHSGISISVLQND